MIGSHLEGRHAFMTCTRMTSASFTLCSMYPAQMLITNPHHVTGHFEKNIGHEEECQTSCILVRSEMEVRAEAEEISVANVCPSCRGDDSLASALAPGCERMTDPALPLFLSRTLPMTRGEDR